MDRLNIGCGNRKLIGYINIDKLESCYPDIVMNIENGLDFPDNYFDEIIADKSLEHISPDKWRFVLSEIYRVSKPGCKLIFILPFDNIYTRTNADHYRTFTWDSFNSYYINRSRSYSDLRLKLLSKRPNPIIRYFYYIFPYLLYCIELKFEVIKNDTSL